MVLLFPFCMSLLLFHKKVLLEKIPGKGGWTYAQIPGLEGAKHSHFGTLRVNGSKKAHVPAG